MTIPRNLSFLAEGASSTGVLGTANGGTGQTSLSSVSVGTSTNLAGGSAGVIPFQTGSGATSFTAAGTSGQVLTSAGSGTPTWSTPSAGALSLLGTLTLSGGSVSITGIGGYSGYFVEFSGINTVGYSEIGAQIGTGSGPTYITSGYAYQRIYANTSTVYTNYGSYSGLGGVYNIGGDYSGGYMWILGNGTLSITGASSSVCTNSPTSSNSVNQYMMYQSQYISGSTINITALQFTDLQNSQTLHGTIRVYGLQ